MKKVNKLKLSSRRTRYEATRAEHDMQPHAEHDMQPRAEHDMKQLAPNTI